MPLTLSISVTKSVGPSDVDAPIVTCGITLALDATPVRGDPALFLARAREAFEACRRAVDDELSRQPQPRREPDVVVDPGQAPRDQSGHESEGRPATRARNHRPATPSQHRALRTIADRLGVDLGEFLRARSYRGGVESLSIIDASRMIDALRACGERSDG